MNIKTSNLYNFLTRTIAGENSDNFNIGASSKAILKKLKYFLDHDTNNDFKNKLLHEHKINIRIAKRIILDEQSKERKEEFKKSFTGRSECINI